MKRFADRKVLKMLQEARDALESILWTWAPEGLPKQLLANCQKAYDLLNRAVMEDVALPELYGEQETLVNNIVFEAHVDNDDLELQEWLDLWRNHYLDTIFNLLSLALKA